jgi:hypothetical protein
MNTKARYSKMAKSIRKTARTQLNRINRPIFRGDEAMKQMFTADAADLRVIARLVGKGQIVKAVKKVNKLDTAVRDELSSFVSEYLWLRNFK